MTTPPLPMADPASLRIGLLAPFGAPPRGVSPYADELACSLEALPDIDLSRLDLIEPYPSIAHPGGAQLSSRREGIRWIRPSTWRAGCPTGLDLLHIQYWTRISLPLLLSAARRAKRHGYVIVVTVHNASPHEVIPGFGALEKHLCNLADKLIVHHETAREDLLDRGIETPVALLPHGVSFETNAEATSATTSSSGQPYILSFGNIRPYKGIDVLLEAWEMLAGEFPQHTLIVAGRLWSGGDSILSKLTGRLLGLKAYSERLRRRLQSAEETGRVRFLNRFLEDEELNELILRSSVATFPYRSFSAQSGAACRAAGLGAPLLVTDVGGLPDLVADSEKQLVRPGDASQLARKLAMLLSHPEDLKRLRATQLDHVRRFAWSNVAREHASLYRRLVG